MILTIIILIISLLVYGFYGILAAFNYVVPDNFSNAAAYFIGHLGYFSSFINFAGIFEAIGWFSLFIAFWYIFKLIIKILQMIPFFWWFRDKGQR